AGELAERSNEVSIKIKHIDEAEEKIDRDRILDTIKTQPKQFQATLLSIFTFASNTNLPIFTGDIYNYYKDICDKCGLKPLTQRRLSDIIAELDMLGIINAKVVSKGRYGRTREISLAIPSTNIPLINQTLRSGLGV
ncbi:cell division control protein Cdc6, partial [Candidatus Woesearchaeota archaeon]|nr:cell division control protein Cdc6 [Candidatus Woesearchaeota archaeon]